MAMKLVDADVLDANLTSIADSIRAKTGGADALSFPSGFVSAVESVESADSALAKIEYDMSNGYTNYERYFQSRQYMTEIPYELMRHISSGVNFSAMFYMCYEITTVESLDTSAGEVFEYMFNYCNELVTIKGIDISNATTTSFMFDGCGKLENITFNGYIKSSFSALSSRTLLTHDSLMSAINALYDHASAGTSGTFTLTLGSTNLAKLTDAEKAIATQKGWTLQ